MLTLVKTILFYIIRQSWEARAARTCIYGTLGLRPLPSHGFPVVRRWHPVQWPGLTFDPELLPQMLTGQHWALAVCLLASHWWSEGRFCYGIGWGLSSGLSRGCSGGL